MSTYVHVTAYGERYSVICTNCDINHEYPTYNKALNNCKAHRLWHHPEQIDWAN